MIAVAVLGVALERVMWRPMRVAAQGCSSSS